MKNTKVVNSVAVAFIVLFLAAAAFSGAFGLLTGKAASGSEKTESEVIPDGLSGSDWDGIRTAYASGRSSSIESIGQEAYLKPAAIGTSQNVDDLGRSVAVSGDTVVVGADGENSSTTGVNTTPNESASSAGAAYVFTRVAGVWTQQAYLKPAAVGTTQASDQFGTSVAISGDTIVVGAVNEDSSTTGVNTTPNESSANSGAVYVFTRTAGVWTQQAYLKPTAVGTSQAGDQFGVSVAVSGDTVVVGATGENSSTTGVNSTPNESSADSGAAYVFTRTAGVWTQQAYLKPAVVGTTQANDLFGISVAVSGDTVAVGALNEDSNTTGVNSTPNESGGGSGAAYVFTRNAGMWTQQAYLKPAAVGTTQGFDQFGVSVGVSGETLVVGADQENSSTTGVNTVPNENADGAGAAYVFTRLAGVWTQQAYLKPALVGTSQEFDNFGYSVAIGADTVAVGARFEPSSTTGVNSIPNESAGSAGAAYVFTRSAGVWSQLAYLKPAAVGTTQLGDQLGTSVAVSGGTVVAGATGEDSSTTGVNSTPNEASASSGAAYIFADSGSTPTPTSTSTNTPTNTPTSTQTATPTATPTGAPAISGTVTYGNAISGPTPPRFVSNVTITGSGSPTLMTTTAAPGGNAGQYALTGFGAGSYTVTPSKTGGVNSITSFDAARIAQHVSGSNLLTGNALVAADVSGNGNVTSFDAGQIALFVSAGSGGMQTGTWKFAPVNRIYPSVAANITGQDYSALLMGEVSGNWTNTGARPVGTNQSQPAATGDSVGDNSGPERSITVSAPRLVTSTDSGTIVQVRVEGADDKGIISYEFELRYDPAVIQPEADPADTAGTLSNELSLVANTEEEAGLLRVVVYGPTPIDGDGILLNLRFTAVGAPGSASPLIWERFMFNEGGPRIEAVDGRVEIAVEPNEGLGSRNY